ncbi:hypothetical protein [Mobilicoccus caccae]|uniref:Uncharacterized protein n=1 Tax=Mobilicoccus caccae TaxID=1859295 RepID=A0ABQ6IPP4_9MICO|nr:hypothetical protein [Mobilicoccus caccae]GMA39300.1 hypothetical protein GCM10025883_13450 [Mobilicoccus caccae]
MATRHVDGEAWLLQRGLPQVVPFSRRVRDTLGRSAPLFVALLVLDTLLQSLVAAWAFMESPSPAAGFEPDLFAAVLLVVLLAAPILAGLAAWLTWRFVRRSPRIARVVAVVAILTWIASAAQSAAQIDGARLWSAVLVRVGVGVFLLGCVVIGVGTVVHWALRRSLLELWSVGPMVVRVLPVLMVAVLFLFFNAEIWQVSAGLDTVRTFGVAGVLSALAVVVVVVTALDELRPDVDSDDHETPAVEDLLRGTPWEGAADGGRTPRLRIGERINFLLVPIAAQSIQVAVFGAVMFAFFIGFGKLAISDSVAKSWITTDPQMLQILDIPSG